MYSRVKRPRKVIKRDMYGIPIQDQESSDDNKNENAEEEEGKDLVFLVDLDQRSR